MTFQERKALVSFYLEKIINIKVDRPLGSTHPKHADMIYPVNYGYIPGVCGGRRGGIRCISSRCG